MTRLVAGSATDVGLVRRMNQDHLLVAEPLFAVADGMGGHAAGEIASETALEALLGAIGMDQSERAWTPGDVADAVRAANRAVWDEAQANPDFKGMGTTLTALALVRDGGADRLAVANVGDSRTYRLREGRLEQLTVDHNLVSELVAEGQIGVDEAKTHPQRHVLTRALGVYPEVEVDLLVADPRVGDRFILCSDGLSQEVPDSQIESVVRRLISPTDVAHELVSLARLHGGSDNITVVVVDVSDDGPGTAREVPPEAEGTLSAARVNGRTSEIAQQRVAADLAEPTGSSAAVLSAGGQPSSPVDGPKARSSGLRRGRPRHTPPPVLGPRNRLVTLRVALWMAALIAVLAAAYGGADYYEHSSYFVGLRGNDVAIYRGRPGGLLWWRPDTKEVTTLRTDDIEAIYRPDLRSGVAEPSLAASRAYVRNLQQRSLEAGLTPATGATTWIRDRHVARGTFL